MDLNAKKKNYNYESMLLLFSLISLVNLSSHSCDFCRTLNPFQTGSSLGSCVSDTDNFLRKV